MHYSASIADEHWMLGLPSHLREKVYRFITSNLELSYHDMRKLREALNLGPI